MLVIIGIAEIRILFANVRVLVRGWSVQVIFRTDTQVGIGHSNLRVGFVVLIFSGCRGQRLVTFGNVVRVNLQTFIVAVVLGREGAHGMLAGRRRSSCRSSQ